MIKLSNSLNVLMALVLCLASPVASRCQEGSVSLSTGIKGSVKDSSQSVVPNVPVTLTSDAGPAQEVKTDNEGNYLFAGLRAGNYSVTVSLPGFEVFQGPGIQLLAGQVVQQNVMLTTAGTKTVTEVQADVPQVETSDPSVFNTLSSKEVAGLQLNGRNFIQLIALTPGVSNQTGQDEAEVGVQGSAAFSVNGGRTEYNTFDLDGSDLLNVGFNGSVNTLIAYPSLDAIGELKILTSNYGAMYGRTASGTVLVTTKSGTNQFHGNLYYFIRNEAFNARNFFDETKGAPLYRRHDLGGTIGGPVYIPGLYNKGKDKTFFFFSEEYRNEKTPYQYNQAVPSLAERNGNFSDVCPAASQLTKDPFSGLSYFQQQGAAGVKVYPDCPALSGLGISPPGGGIALAPFPGNNLFAPGSGVVLNRNAAVILGTGIIPLPNSGSGCNSSINSCYASTVSEPTHWREELFRIDQYFNERNRLMFRFVHDSWNTITGTPQYGVIANTVPTIQNNFNGPGVNAIARFSQTLSPTLLNEAFFSYANSNIALTNANGPNAQWRRPAALDAPCANYPAGQIATLQCGLGSLFNNGSGGKIPGLQLLGNAEYGGGLSVDSGYMPWSHTNPIYTFGDTVTKQWGKHFLQGGSEFIFYLRDQTNSVSGSATGDTQGILTFTGQQGSSGNLFGTGNAFANFLAESVVDLSQPGTALRGSGSGVAYQQDSAQLRYHQRYGIAEPYLQDDWKVSPRLTVNLGLRLSLFGRYRELNNNVYNWTPSAYNPVLASQIGIDPNNGQVYIPPVLNSLNTTGTDLSFAPGNPDPHLLNGLVRCGYNGVSPSCMQGHLVNPAPRFGFAWDPFGNGKTSVRGGYGIFFEHGTGNETNTGSLEGSSPLVLSMNASANDLSCIGNSNPGPCNNSGARSSEIPAYPLNVTSIQSKTQWPYVQQWSFSIQREMPRHTIVSLAYVGSKGTHLTAERQINALSPVSPSQNPFASHQPFVAAQDCVLNGPGNQFASLAGTQAYNNLGILCSYNFPGESAQVINGLRPYLGIGQIVAIQNIANSSYNALQATVRHTTGALTLGLSYTYSHSLDSSSDRFDPVPDSTSLHANWASSSFDQRNLLNLSYIYDVPNPANWKNSRLLRNTAGGWQWSGITVFQSGIPFSVINNPTGGISTADNAGVANGVGVASIQSYPDLVGNPKSKPPAAGNNGTTIGPLLANPAAFAAPQGLTYGTAGRNSINNPDRWNFDMSLFKNFKIAETQSLQFRAEVFNVFNNTQFEIYNPAKRNQENNTITCYGDASTGYSAGAANCLAGNAFLHPIDAHRPRTMQLALKFTF